MDQRRYDSYDDQARARRAQSPAPRHASHMRQGSAGSSGAARQRQVSRADQPVSSHASRQPRYSTSHAGERPYARSSQPAQPVYGRQSASRQQTATPYRMTTDYPSRSPYAQATERRHSRWPLVVALIIVLVVVTLVVRSCQGDLAQKARASQPDVISITGTLSS